MVHAFKHCNVWWATRLACFAGLGVLNVAASAQSAITIYGVADSFVGRASGSTSVMRVQEGGHIASQVGFKGTEDLGGGMSAGFVLEAGIAMDSGAGTVPGPGLAFTRQSFVSLGDANSWGTISMGRQYTPLFRTTWRADPFGNNTIFSPYILWAQTDAQPNFQAWQARSDNSVLYTSPSSLPVSVSLMYAPGEAANSASGNYTGGSVSWTGGPLWAGAAFQKVRSGTAAAPVANPFTSTSNVVSASYEQGPWRLGGSVGSQGSNAPGSPKAKLWNLSAQYDISAQHRLMVGVGDRKVDGSMRGQRATVLGYHYMLSKRTDFYIRSYRLTNRGDAGVSLAQIPINANSGADGTHNAIGIVHRF